MCCGCHYLLSKGRGISRLYRNTCFVIRDEKITSGFLTLAVYVLITLLVKFSFQKLCVAKYFKTLRYYW